MRAVHTIHAAPRMERALDATAELLSKSRLDAMFVGTVARSAWLGVPVEAGSIDVLALMGPQQRNQLAMMANNRGFIVDRDELEAAEELDLVPIRFPDDDGGVRVHVLVGSNALYGRMVAAGVMTEFGERQLKVPALEDFALLVMMGDDERSRAEFAQLTELPAFRRETFNERVVSIGLGERALRG